jgi:hypothetical protein
MSILAFIEGFGFDPFLRGFLVVLAGVIVLMGSVYAIVASNTGLRSGMLIALAGLFGWLFIMGLIWWMYGIGLRGTAPSWNVIELNRGDLSVAALPEARDLEDWRELPASDPARGEAQASVDAFLLESGEFDSIDQYVAVAGFDIGGKPKRASDSVWDRVTNRVTNTLRVTHPTHYALIEVQRVTPESLIVEPGQAPPPKEADPDQPVLSVIMVRDLGHVRRTPAVVTILCGAIFAALCWMLHDRDRRLDRARAEFAAST